MSESFWDGLFPPVLPIGDCTDRVPDIGPCTDGLGMFSEAVDSFFDYTTVGESVCLRMSTAADEDRDDTSGGGDAGPAPKEGDRPLFRDDESDGGSSGDGNGDDDWKASPPCDRCAKAKIDCWMPPTKQSKVTKCAGCRASSSKGKCSLSGR